MGYSGSWLAEAAQATDGRVTPLEMQDYKSAHARDMATWPGRRARSGITSVLLPVGSGVEISRYEPS